MHLALLLVLVLGLGATAAAGRLLPGQPGFSLRALLSAQENPFDAISLLRETSRRAKQQVAVQHIHEAVQASGSRGSTGHATAAGTRDGADFAAGALAHTDRKRRLLLGTQENVMSGSLDMRDSMRQASAADARSRIKAAVDAGAALQVTSAAGTASELPLRRRRLLQDGGGGGITGDSFRGVQRQERVFTTTSMIPKAVDGQMEVAGAIAAAQAPVSKGVLISGAVAAQTAGAAAAVAGAVRALP